MKLLFKKMLIIFIIFSIVNISFSTKLKKTGMNINAQQLNNSNSQNRRNLIKYSTKFMRPTINSILDNRINPRFLVDEMTLEDSLDPNASHKIKYHDYNHDFEKHSIEEVENRLYEHLAPEHVDYNFD